MFPINCPLAFNREINGMKKLNSKYVESVVKKAADGKIVAVHREKTLEHGPNREKAGDEGQKKDWKTNMEAGTKSPVKKYGDFKQEIPRKQITS